MIDHLNSIPDDQLYSIFAECCGSTLWKKKLVNLRPYRDLNDLIEKSNSVWYSLKVEDWKEAFSVHPKIGDLDSLREKYGKHETWSKGEQSKVNKANEATIQALQKHNSEYFKKFGYIFIVFATGKTAEEMLEILEKRLPNSTFEEIEIAGREQNKITRLRLEKLQQQ